MGAGCFDRSGSALIRNIPHGGGNRFAPDFQSPRELGVPGALLQTIDLVGAWMPRLDACVKVVAFAGRAAIGLEAASSPRRGLEPTRSTVVEGSGPRLPGSRVSRDGSGVRNPGTRGSARGRTQMAEPTPSQGWQPRPKGGAVQQDPGRAPVQIPRWLDTGAALAWRFLLVAIAVYVLVLVLQRLLVVVIPVALAAMLATVLVPPAHWLRRHGARPGSRHGSCSSSASR